MNKLPFDAPLEEYQVEAEKTFALLQAGDAETQWRFKWMHPRFSGKTLHDVRVAQLDLADAQLLTAREYHFDSWSDLADFASAVRKNSDVARFEHAVEAVIAGDIPTLKTMLQQHPQLVRERSVRNHHATLLHYVAANGVEGFRQKTPDNAVEVARLLLDAGAEPDALADMYDNKCTTMSMLVSSAHPAGKGVQAPIAELLLDYGAALEGPGTEWQSALMTALTFGYLDTAKALVKRGARIPNIVAAAGLGMVDEVRAQLPNADEQTRHKALALAALHGQTDVIGLLLDAGEDPNRYNPEGFHSHGTPLHHAVWTNKRDTVQLLLDRGARLDIKDALYEATPLGWAVYGNLDEMADYLRSRGAQ